MAGGVTEAATGNRPRRGGWLRHAIGLAISVGCVWAIFTRVDLAQLQSALSTFRWSFLLFGIASLAGGYAMRILRWSALLRAAGMQTSFRNCAAPFLGSIALNNVLPLRLGDVVRAFVFPSAMNMPRSTVAGSLVLERLTDLVTLLICLGISLSAVRSFAIPASLRDAAITAGVIGGASLVVLLALSGWLSRQLDAAAVRFGTGRLERPLTIGASLLRDCQAMTRPATLARVVALSALAWVGETGLFYAVLRGFGSDATAATALLAMSLSTLATLVPSSPGYVGPFHLAAFTALTIAGQPAEIAGSFAIVTHLALWSATTLAGAGAILLRPQLFEFAWSRNKRPANIQP